MRRCYGARAFSDIQERRAAGQVNGMQLRECVAFQTFEQTQSSYDLDCADKIEVKDKDTLSVLGKWLVSSPMIMLEYQCVTSAVRESIFLTLKEEVVWSQDWRCNHCQELCPSLMKLTVKALSLGGEDDINMQALCNNCYAQKPLETSDVHVHCGVPKGGVQRTNFLLCV